jgi:AcrR family transcriptional regulator
MRAVRARRADAVRNRERIIAVAQEMFSRDGLDVPVEDIAVGAGVGKATVYRSFPTKEHLIAAIAGDRLDWLAGLADEAYEEEDACAAFRQLVLTLAEAQASDRALADIWSRAVTLEATQERRQAMRDAMGRLMAKAKAESDMIDDITVDDVRIFVIGTAHAMAPEDRSNPDAWRRTAEMFLRGVGC